MEHVAIIIPTTVIIGSVTISTVGAEQFTTRALTVTTAARPPFCSDGPHTTVIKREGRW